MIVIISSIIESLCGIKNGKMKKRPNILWISFEDTNPFYGCYGDKIARTPNLDKFASEGCVYTHCFSTSGVCAPPVLQ
ncbi:MAG: sulfatase-like hydrolase/transferase [Elusimicrobiales bacterium]